MSTTIGQISCPEVGDQQINNGLHSFCVSASISLDSGGFCCGGWLVGSILGLCCILFSRL